MGQWRPGCVDFQGDDRVEDDSALMVMTPGRIAYRGLLGTHAERVFGAITIYVAIRRPFKIRRNGRVEESTVSIVPPYEMHQIITPDENIAMLIEPEAIGGQRYFERLSDVDPKSFAKRIVSGFSQIGDNEIECREFDSIFFGEPLAAHRLDRRIRRVVESVQANPAARHSAEQYARHHNLSVSRFSHLFRSELGATFRGFCAWKRARGVLALTQNDEKLVETALTAGYADSTHFSHSMRQYFGQRPRDIVALMGVRQLRLLANPGNQAVDWTTQLAA